MFRARAMRALAVRRGLHYVGPPSIKWWGLRTISPPVPIPFSLVRWPNMRGVFNVIEGQQEGVRVLIFDSLLGRGVGPGSHYYRTLFACKTDQNFLGTDATPEHATQSLGRIGERVVQSNGWSVVYQSLRFVGLPLRTWSMGIHELEDHLNKLRAASGERM
jgi:hypothetical protein